METARSSATLETNLPVDNALNSHTTWIYNVVLRTSNLVTYDTNKFTMQQQNTM